MRKLKKLGTGKVTNGLHGVKFDQPVDCMCDYSDCEYRCQTYCNLYGGNASYQGIAMSGNAIDVTNRDISNPRT